MNIVKEKKIAYRYFELYSQVEGNVVKDCDFFRFQISVSGGCCG
jgi:hypothetical protein